MIGLPLKFWLIGGLLLAASAVYAKQAWTIRGLERDTASLQQALAQSRANVATCVAANTDWEDAAKAQAEAFDTLQAQCDAHTARLESAVQTYRASQREAIQQEQTARRELRTILETDDCEALRQTPVCPAAADRLRDNP